MATDSEVERLIGTATRLFAELGYDGTSARLIADAAGVDVATLVAEAGDRPQLYRTVMMRAHNAEREAMEAALARFDGTRAGLSGLLDAYLDFCVDNPHVLALWQHRWMGDAADVPGLEQLYSRPLALAVSELVAPLIPEDVPADFLVWSVVWCVYGYLTGGMQTADPMRHEGRRSGVPPQDLEAFRRFLHTMILRMTSPQQPGR
ncbi:TetR/AcrR family transcriptional regulator [Thermomonospora cellulosilytica]|uniref:AcrR family transcriptional regulator n=1 Tax=Thermomonospora cellulosilytica TaxID=1411118 RepID=A0A7W3N2J0_9ACTN|nr:TetR/AcrR family transcriptional regulator [Thermomonospora cellulosilytica]MBA9006369.1 AcrR family transcriptional regulator [Thermomonospora cellulosilytica]